MRPKIKICGIADPAFAAEAARRGVDYIGVVFAASSPRRVDAGRAREIAAAVREACPESPPKTVGVFVGGGADEILETAEAASLDVVQLHGGHDRETAAWLRGAGLEVWRLVESGSDVVVPDGSIDMLLLDGRVGGKTGGTGRRADWSLVGKLKADGFRVVLAGGLSPENAAEAAATGADVLDFNSALETSPGVKSLLRLNELLRRLETGRHLIRRSLLSAAQFLQGAHQFRGAQ